MYVTPLEARSENSLGSVACKCFGSIPPLVKGFFHIQPLLLGSVGQRRLVEVVAGVLIHFAGFIDVHTNVLPALTVVCLEELVHMCVVFFFGHKGIPHQFCNEVSAQFAKLTGNGLVVTLGIHTLYVVFCKELHIFTQNVKGCVGCNVVAIVGYIVPNVNTVTNLAPVIHILYKGCVGRAGCIG